MAVANHSASGHHVDVMKLVVDFQLDYSVLEIWNKF